MLFTESHDETKNISLQTQTEYDYIIQLTSKPKQFRSRMKKKTYFVHRKACFIFMRFM